MSTVTLTKISKPATNGHVLRMTEQEFVNWCDENTWAEWVDGEVIQISLVNFDNDEFFVFLLTLMKCTADEQDAGSVLSEPMHVRLGKLRVRRSPDIFFISNQRKDIIQYAHIEGAPDLILEIISPDSQSRDRRDKFHEYESAGVMEYWIVDPLSKTFEAYTLVGKKYRLIEEASAIKSKILPGFAIKPAWLWLAKLPKIAACLREMKSIK